MAEARKTEDSCTTRNAILDATEQIMREDGYAAVSSRRVADRAGLKSQLVHYHFGSMDDLFLALFQRTEKHYLARYALAASAENPLRALWQLSIDRPGMEVMFEFMALANHHLAIREELARSTENIRAMQTALLTEALAVRGIATDLCPPDVLALLIAGTARALVNEAAIGVTAAHAATLGFAERLFQKIDQNHF